MVAPKHVRRAEEIKRLTKQLEELRAARDRMSADGPPPPPPASAASAASAPPPAPGTPEAPASSPAPPLGRHGEGSRFLSMSQVGADEFFPRILTVAGRVPGLTVAQLLSAPPVLQDRPPDAGNLFLTKVPDGFRGQLIALPGLALTAACADPVVVLIDPKELSAAQLPVAEGDDVVLLVDRDIEGMDFDKTKIYAWAEGDVVRVGWRKEMPPPEVSRCLGRVVFGITEVRKELRKATSCFEEENETYAS